MHVRSRAGWRALAVALLFPTAALAQVDIEYRDTTLEIDEKLVYRIGFEVEWHEYDNLDFRPIDESSDQAILDSDDRGSFAFTGLSAAFGYSLDDHVRFVLGVSHRGLWGNDQLGLVSKYAGWMYFTSAYVEADTAGDNPIRFRVGRQFFSIGGLPAPEFVFLDIVDAVRVDIPIAQVGYITALPIEVPSASSAHDRANFVGFIGSDNASTFGFRGDTMTRRHGAVLVLDRLVENLDARAYGFYTDVGARGTGSDITYNGLLGNFSDNDWVANFGVRASYKLGPVTPWASFDVSHGIDRKELVAPDVDTNGLSWYVGANLATGDEDAGLRATASYFDSYGAAYRGDGMQYSHGYVGMKAAQVGGLLADRFMGMHPTAYVAMFGVDDNAHRTDRKGGTRALHGSIGYKFPKLFEARASYWFLQDTGLTTLNQNDLDTIDPPFGYSKEQFAAQERLGKVLGHEANLDVFLRLTPNLSLRASGGVFLPGSFYAIEVGRIAGNSLGGQAPAWAVNSGLRVRF